MQKLKIENLDQINFLAQPELTNISDFQALINFVKSATPPTILKIKKKMAIYIHKCFVNGKRKRFYRQKLPHLIGALLYKCLLFQLHNTAFELNFTFKYYRMLFKQRLFVNWRPLQSERIQFNVNPSLANLYNERIQEQKKLQRQQNTQIIQPQIINQFVFNISENKLKLPQRQCLCCAQFFYRNWKIASNVNQNVKVYGIDVEGAKKKYEMARRICAVGNMGGGLLFIGVNPKTLRVQGFRISQEQKQAYIQQIKIWKKLHNGMLIIHHHFIPVFKDPLYEEQQIKGLYILRLDIKLGEDFENYVFITLKIDSKRKYEGYVFTVSDKIEKITGQKHYQLMVNGYDNSKKRRKSHHWKQSCKKPKSIRPIQLQDEELTVDSDKETLLEEKEVKEPVIQNESEEEERQRKQLAQFPCKTMLFSARKKITEFTRLTYALKDRSIKNKMKLPYENFQEGRQIRLIYHFDQIQIIQKVAKEIKNLIIFEEITKTLRLQKDISHETLKKFKKQYLQIFPKGYFDFQYAEQINQKYKQSFMNFYDIQESIFAKVYLQNQKVYSTFVRNE